MLMLIMLIVVLCISRSPYVLEYAACHSVTASQRHSATAQQRSQNTSFCVFCRQNKAENEVKDGDGDGNGGLRCR